MRVGGAIEKSEVNYGERRTSDSIRFSWFFSFLVFLTGNIRNERQNEDVTSILDDDMKANGLYGNMVWYNPLAAGLFSLPSGK